MTTAPTVRCEGGNCPSRDNCRLHTERYTGIDSPPYAALHARREAGSSACDMVIFVKPVTTFAGEA